MAKITSIKKTQKSEAFKVPAEVNKDSFSSIQGAISEAKLAYAGGEVHLDFSDCTRITTSGLGAMTALAEELADKDCFIYIDNINNTLFKSLKITGKQSYFRFVHQGEYLSRQFQSGGPRC